MFYIQICFSSKRLLVKKINSKSFCKKVRNTAKIGVKHQSINQSINHVYDVCDLIIDIVLYSNLFT